MVEPVELNPNVSFVSDVKVSKNTSHIILKTKTSKNRPSKYERHISCLQFCHRRYDGHVSCLQICFSNYEKKKHILH